MKYLALLSFLLLLSTSCMLREPGNIPMEDPIPPPTLEKCIIEVLEIEFDPSPVPSFALSGGVYKTESETITYEGPLLSRLQEADRVHLSAIDMVSTTDFEFLAWIEVYLVTGSEDRVRIGWGEGGGGSALSLLVNGDVDLRQGIQEDLIEYEVVLRARSPDTALIIFTTAELFLYTCEVEDAVDNGGDKGYSE